MELPNVWLDLWNSCSLVRIFWIKLFYYVDSEQLSAVKEEKAGSLYVCGCPGTGKSISMENVKMSLAVWDKEVISICLIVHFVIPVELMHLHNYSHHLKDEDYNEWNHVLFPDRRSIPRHFGHKLYFSLNYFRNFQQGKNLSIHWYESAHMQPT